MNFINHNYHSISSCFRSYSAFIIILLPLFADILTGLIDIKMGIYLPISVLVRVGIIALGLYLVFFKQYMLSKLVLFIAIFYLLLCSYWFVSQREISLAIELKTLSLLLLPFLIYLLFKHNINSEIQKEKMTLSLSLYGLVASTSIILFYFLNIGYESYGDYAFGFKGVFISGNDIGISIVLCSAISWYRICRYSMPIDFLSAFISFIGLIFIASRTGIIFGTLVLLLGVISYIFFYKSQRSSILIIKSIIVMLVLFIISVIIWLSIKYSQEIIYHSSRLLELLDGVSPREHLEYAAEQVYESLTNNNILFGQGWSFYAAIGEEHYLRLTLHYHRLFEKNIEKDFHDLFGYTGIVFTLFYTSIMLFVVSNLLIKYVSKRQPITMLSLFLFSFLMLHATFAGHIVFGSQVPIIAAAIIFLGINFDATKKQLS